MVRKILGLLVVFVVILSFAFAAKQLLPFQARIVDANGNIVSSGDVNIQIYDSNVGGNLIYSEIATISNGYVDVILGQSSDLDLNQGAYYWLDLDINTGSGYEDLNFNNKDRLQFESTRGNILVVNESPSDDFIIQIPDYNSFQVKTSSKTLMHISGNSTNFWNNNFVVMDENGNSLVWYDVNKWIEDSANQNWDIIIGNYALKGFNYGIIFRDTNIADTDVNYASGYLAFRIGDLNIGAPLLHPINLLYTFWDYNNISGVQDSAFGAAPFRSNQGDIDYGLDYSSSFNAGDHLTGFSIKHAYTGNPISYLEYDSSTPSTKYEIYDGNTGNLISSLSYNNGSTKSLGFNISDANSGHSILSLSYTYDGSWVSSTDFSIFSGIPGFFFPALTLSQDLNMDFFNPSAKTEFRIYANGPIITMDGNDMYAKISSPKPLSIEVSNNNLILDANNQSKLYLYASGDIEAVPASGKKFYVTGDAQISKSLYINNDLDVYGNADVNDLDANVAEIKDLNAYSIAKLYNADLYNQVDISGDLNFYGGVRKIQTNDNNLDINVHTKYLNILGKLTTSGQATLDSLSVTNNASVGGTLSVTGNTTLNNGLTVSNGGLTVSSGGLTVTGDSTFNDNLTVNGTLAIASLDTNSADLNYLDVNNTANFDGAVTMKNGLTVSSGGLTVTGDSTFNDNVTVDGNVTFSGTWFILPRMDTPPTCDSSLEGAMYYDTGDNLVYVCTDYSGSYAWEDLNYNP